MVEGTELDQLILDMQRKIEAMTKWLRDSGLTVNEAKTECCLFYKNDHQLINIKINDVTIRSKPSINVLGVLFDSKLNWSTQVAQTIMKAKKTLHAIKLIRKFFRKDELKQLLTSNFFSVLYYNCEVWLTPMMDPRSKQQLLAASTMALKLCESQHDNMISYERLHEIHGRATPLKMMKYRLAIQLYKVYNGRIETEDWIDLNFQQNFNNRNTRVQISDTSNLRIGRNSLMNRMNCINNKIDYSWLNKSIDSYKILCKQTFLA